MGAVYYIRTTDLQAKTATTLKTSHDRIISYVVTRVLSPRLLFTWYNHYNSEHSKTLGERSMNNSEQLYKISEIADIAKVNKTKVWRYIRDNNISERSMKGNAKLYSEHNKDLIIKAFSNYSVHFVTETKADTSRILLEQIEILKGELERKNDQLDKMQSLLDQQQQLNLSTNRQNEKLLNTPQKASEDVSKDDTDGLESTENYSKVEEVKTSKKGLFGWLRH